MGCLHQYQLPIRGKPNWSSRMDVISAPPRCAEALATEVVARALVVLELVALRCFCRLPLAPHEQLGGDK